MKFLLDTHVLFWAAATPNKLSRSARKLLDDSANELFFSAASIWEIAIKKSLFKDSLNIESHALRRALMDNEYIEIPINGEHAAAIELLPPVHKDPFDRILIAQAITEGITLLTVDPVLVKYPGPVRKI